MYSEASYYVEEGEEEDKRNGKKGNKKPKRKGGKDSIFADYEEFAHLLEEGLDEDAPE